MDGESSYESDISESWSLIDINVNEESHPVTVSPSESEKGIVTDSKEEKSRKRSDLELKDFLEKCKETHTADHGPSNSLDSSSSSFANEGFVNCTNENADGIPSSCRRSGDDGPNDSDDVESIEILDMDGNFRDSEVDRLDTVIDSQDSQTYQSDDEESPDESTGNESRANGASVIKRRRRRVVKNPESPVNSVNSEDGCGHCDSKTCLTEEKTNNDDVSKESCTGASHPVVKHYKSNVATTVLSLSMGVIFAGVACIAIGHFLGVQDAADTAGELVDALKKLQVENAALQSRLFHLNRVLLNQQTNSKSGLDSCRETHPVDTSAIPERPVEWLSELENLLRNDDKVVKNAVDLKTFEKYIHDRLDVLRNEKEVGAKFLEDADRKIPEGLQMTVTRILSKSQGDVENLRRGLTNLGGRSNKNLNEGLPDSPPESGVGKPKLEMRVPVTELDLQSVRWSSVGDVPENSPRESPRSLIVYRFPQPEKYYQVELGNVVNVEEKPFAPSNSSETLKDGFSERVEKKDKQSDKGESAKCKQKKRKKEKEVFGEKKEKKQKRAVNKSTVKQTDKGKRKTRKAFGWGPAKAVFGPGVDHFILSQRSRHTRAEVVKPKLKKMKNPKLKKSFLFKLKKDGFGKKKHSRRCSTHHCLNSTGFWVFRWAGGREEFRRHQALGDWQFERARGREGLRDGYYDVNWQMKRAMGRESKRDGDRWQHGKRMRFNGQEFFHDRFS